MKLLAIDVGYSSVKVARHDSAGLIQFDKFINAVAKIDNPLEIDNDIMKQYSKYYNEINENRNIVI